MLRRVGDRDWLALQTSRPQENLCLPIAKAVVDTVTIKDLGRWESLEMVQRFARSVTFQGSLKFYKGPLS